jgi:lipopolysaccharide transport system permease protein
MPEKYFNVDDKVVHVYAAGQKSRIWQILAAILKDFSMAHSLGFRLAERNIKARYRQSVFGVLWALLPPLATAAVWILLNNNNIVSISSQGINYPLFVITGTMLWSVFSNAVFTPILTVQNNASILVKMNFPREALIINAFYEILFGTLIALVIIIGEMVYFKISFTPQTFLFFPAVLVLIIMGICVGLILMPLAILLKDVQFVLPTLLQFAMYLTPVVYTTPISGGYSKLLSFNPISPVLNFARESIMGSTFSVSLLHFSIISIIAIIILLIGLVLQRLAMEILIERMGS